MTALLAYAVSLARSQRPVQPLEVLASADRDVRINAEQLVTKRGSSRRH